MTKRTEKRAQFLKDVLVTAVESYGYTPWFQFDNYNPDNGTVTVYHDENEDGEYSDGPYQINLDDVARGLRLYREAWADPPTYTSPTTGETTLMYPARNTGSYRYQLLVADRTNGDDGDFDVTTADSVLQMAVLGKEIYG